MSSTSTTRTGRSRARSGDPSAPRRAGGGRRPRRRRRGFERAHGRRADGHDAPAGARACGAPPRPSRRGSRRPRRASGGLRDARCGRARRCRGRRGASAVAISSPRAPSASRSAGVRWSPAVGRGDGAVVAREDGLVALAVERVQARVVGLAPDVGRQGHAAVALEEGEEVGADALDDPVSTAERRHQAHGLAVADAEDLARAERPAGAGERRPRRRRAAPRARAARRARPCRGGPSSRAGRTRVSFRTSRSPGRELRGEVANRARAGGAAGRAPGPAGARPRVARPAPGR